MIHLKMKAYLDCCISQLLNPQPLTLIMHRNVWLVRIESAKKLLSRLVDFGCYAKGVGVVQVNPLKKKNLSRKSFFQIMLMNEVVKICEK